MDSENRKKITQFCFFATLGSSFFLWGFSQKMSNWKKKDHSFDGKMPNVLLEEGQELAMKALKKGTVMSLIGCSTVFIAGYVIIKSLDLKPRNRTSYKECDISTFQDLVNFISKS